MGRVTAVDTGPAVGGDRREARRQARRNAMVGAAMGIVAREGVPGLTMQAVADRVGCSVGTVYNFYSSKGVLIADLQDTSVQRILRSLVLARERNRRALDAVDATPRDRACADLYLFGDFFVACWDAFPEESHMLFSVLAERREIVPPTELGRVMGSTLGLLALGRETVDAAVAADVIEDGPAMDRVVMASSALLGVLLTSHLHHIDPVAFDHRRLTLTTWRALLRGWGMGPADQAWAQAHVDELAAVGPMAPDPDL